MRSTDFVVNSELTIVRCWCGTPHAVPIELAEFQERQHRNGREVTGIYCPLGHVHVPAGKSEVEQVRAQLAKVTAELDQERAAHTTERAAHKRTSNKLTRANKRTANGVCPCCQRSFVQLTRHMRTKHPDYVTASNGADQ